MMRCLRLLPVGFSKGHGRDVGRLAAQVVAAFMQDWLTRQWGAVKVNPAEAFRTMFREVRVSNALGMWPLFLVIIHRNTRMTIDDVPAFVPHCSPGEVEGPRPS